MYIFVSFKEIKENGIFVLNCFWDDEEMEHYMPHYLLRQIADKNIQFYYIKAHKIAEEIGLGNRINMIMQGAFFKLSDILEKEIAKQYLKDAITKMYQKKGEKIVKMNHLAIDKGFEQLNKVKIKEEWKNYSIQENESNVEEPTFIKTILRPLSKNQGNDLPVSTFKGMEDGSFPVGSAAYEKRGIGIHVPQWKQENCIQCNQCAFICPHACIRPFLLDEEEQRNAPKGFETKTAVGKEMQSFYYRLQVSPLDCIGCGKLGSAHVGTAGTRFHLVCSHQLQ